MKSTRCLLVISLAIFLGLLILPNQPHSAWAAQTAKCSVDAFKALGLVDQEFKKPVEITSAKLVPAAEGAPEHCECRGSMWPQINFVVKMPAKGWNGRFYMVGGGGWNGIIKEKDMIPALAAGCATAGTDSGHPKSERLATFAYNPPDNSNPHAAQKKKDFAYRSYHETSVAARALIKAFMGQAPKYSYWVGCSEGGREALLMAQRYPKDFQGIICGAPVLYLTRAHMWSIWNPHALLGDGKIFAGPPDKLNQIPYLAEVIYSRCDGRDGLVDGLIDDPRQCDFDPARDLNICDQPSDTCFTPAQIQALQRIYGGVRTSYGMELFPGMPLGAEKDWNPWIIGAPSRQELYGNSSILYYSSTPPLADRKNAQGQPWKWQDFDYDWDPGLLEETSKLVDMIDTNLAEFKKAGGKLIHYSGWNDSALTPLMTIDYYQGVRKTMGAKATDAFYRLYLIPGTAHCGGGVGCFDRNKDLSQVLFPALVNWVEGNTPPGTLKGTRPADGRSRPMCPYPQVARFLGSGGKAGIEDAKNFACLEPATAQVRVQAPVSLGKDAVFTARLALPNGVNAKGLKPVALVCAGAAGAKVRKVTSQVKPYQAVYGKEPPVIYYQAEFKTADLINIKPGDAVPFTLTAVFDQGGKRLAFEGGQMVQVLP